MKVVGLISNFDHLIMGRPTACSAIKAKLKRNH